MPEQPATTLDLTQFSREPGESRTMEIDLYLPPIHLAGQDYGFVPDTVPARIALIFTGSGFNIEMKFSASLEGECWRCLEPARIDLDVDVQDFFEIERPPVGEMAEEDEASFWYEEDGTLNLSAWARDAAAEQLPSKILCDPECRGLCPQCGVNLNVVTCGCEPPADSRWDKLRELLD
ncbi:MAG: DUF177 domain-containing protein [Thermoleophilia bacterium]|nr:DUF177 domain-containing protein [Thermoleophilia bacterium]